jgi:hypothetical protein
MKEISQSFKILFEVDEHLRAVTIATVLLFEARGKTNKQFFNFQHITRLENIFDLRLSCVQRPAS